MSYTIEMYQALKEAMASGERVVMAEGRRIEYRSVEEMERILGRMEDELFPKKKKPRVAVFKKGL